MRVVSRFCSSMHVVRAEAVAFDAGIPCRFDLCACSKSMQHSCAGNAAGIRGNLRRSHTGWGIAACLHKRVCASSAQACRGLLL